MWGFYETEEAETRAKRTRCHHGLCFSTAPVLGAMKPFRTDWVTPQVPAHWE